MRRTLMALALLLPAGPAIAQTGTVYRCKDASGHQSLQSHPCDPGQTVEAAQSYQRERLTRAQEDAIRRHNIRPVERAPLPGATATVITPKRTASACATAKARRDQEYRNNPKMGYRGRQAWGDYVRNACK